MESATGTPPPPPPESTPPPEPAPVQVFDALETALRARHDLSPASVKALTVMWRGELSVVQPEFIRDVVDARLARPEYRGFTETPPPPSPPPAPAPTGPPSFSDWAEGYRRRTADGLSGQGVIDSQAKPPEPLPPVFRDDKGHDAATIAYLKARQEREDRKDPWRKAQ